MKNLPSSFLLNLAAALLFLVPTAAICETPVSKRTILFDYTEGGFPPYYIVDDGKLSGITHDILMQAFSSMGWTMRTTFHPELRGMDLLDRDEVDCRGKAREWMPCPEKYDWSEPFLFPCEVLVSLARSPVDATGLDGKKSLHIVGIHGFSYPSLDKAITRGIVHRQDVETPQHQLLLLNKNRTDAAVMDEFAARWIIKTTPGLQAEDFHISKLPGATFGYRLMFNTKRNWKPFIMQFNDRVKAMLQDGSIDRIIANYR